MILFDTNDLVLFKNSDETIQNQTGKKIASYCVIAALYEAARCFAV